MILVLAHNGALNDAALVGGCGIPLPFSRGALRVAVALSTGRSRSCKLAAIAPFFPLARVTDLEAIQMGCASSHADGVYSPGLGVVARPRGAQSTGLAELVAATAGDDPLQDSAFDDVNPLVGDAAAPPAWLNDATLDTELQTRNHQEAPDPGLSESTAQQSSVSLFLSVANSSSHTMPTGGALLAHPPANQSGTWAHSSPGMPADGSFEN